MAMWEPEASGAGERHIPEDDDPVLRAMRNAPIGEPLTEDERRALEEWRSDPVGVDTETILRIIVEKAKAEGAAEDDPELLALMDSYKG